MYRARSSCNEIRLGPYVLIGLHVILTAIMAPRNTVLLPGQATLGERPE